MIEVWPDMIENGRWVARYDRWEVSRECPIRAVADVLAFEVASIVQEEEAQ